MAENADKDWTDRSQRPEPDDKYTKYRAWIALFNDPHGFLESSPQTQETEIKEYQRERSFYEVILDVEYVLKNAILTVERYYEGKADDSAVRDSLERVNSLPSLKVTHRVNVLPQGEFAHQIGTIEIEKAARDRYGETNLAREIGLRIEQFKEWIAQEGENFKIGVCKYPLCRLFYVKKRKDARYCSKNHAKHHWRQARDLDDANDRG